MSIHSHTPTLHVFDPRSLAVREVGYSRSAATEPAQARVTRHTYDDAGMPVADWDPRLWELAAPANTLFIRSLSGLSLLEESVDAGWRLKLLGPEGQCRETRDSRGNCSLTDHDTLMRPVCVTESMADNAPRVVERLSYGAASQASASKNQCGQLVRHDDTAGTWQALEYGLTNTVLVENRCFLADGTLPDWPLQVSERNQLLESITGFTSQSMIDAAGTVIGQIDAVGNLYDFRPTVSGQLKQVCVQLSPSSVMQPLAAGIEYDALGRLLKEVLGNGVTSENTYDSAGGRMIRMRSIKADGATLQDLNFEYDPVGNITSINDLARPSGLVGKRDSQALHVYRYDTLYQLIEASGYEVATAANQGPALPDLQTPVPDPHLLNEYIQKYQYDAGGNLLELCHIGNSPFTRRMRVAANSNRSLPQEETEMDFSTAFDANGNLLELVRGQLLEWDLRNQLTVATTLRREDGVSDNEHYLYDAKGQRCRKTNTAKASSRSLVSTVSYLPGLEIRTNATGEILHVCSIQPGLACIRILHWQTGKPDGMDNDQIRYSLGDQIASSRLELDEKGSMISHERYYPFGGTAWWAARSAIEAKYKTVRYSGKERDATGLYYYGFRYYAPWRMRWISADPAGPLDGLNLFTFVMNSPVTNKDMEGKQGEDAGPLSYTIKDLKDRLEARKSLNPARYAFIENEYHHSLYAPYGIASKSPIAEKTYVSSFENTYMPEQWTFELNMRFPHPAMNIYANEVAMVQYERVSKQHNFFGKLPSVIKRSCVMNQGVLDLAEKYPSGSSQFMQDFFTVTQNGKSTQRIMDDFGLTATRVEFTHLDLETVDVVVHVKPKDSEITSQLPAAANDPAHQPPKRRSGLSGLTPSCPAR